MLTATATAVSTNTIRGEKLPFDCLLINVRSGSKGLRPPYISRRAVELSDLRKRPEPKAVRFRPRLTGTTPLRAPSSGPSPPTASSLSSPVCLCLPASTVEERV